MLEPPLHPLSNRPFNAAKSAVGLAVGLRLVLVGFQGVLLRVDTKESVYLFLGHRTVARCRRHHEIAHQLDLGLEVIICEVVTSRLSRHHVPNLRACRLWLYQLPTIACPLFLGGPPSREDLALSWC